MKQSQIRSKVEKMNRSETWSLNRKLKVIDRECQHFNAMLIREKREINLKLIEMQKTSGHSIMSVHPDPHDKAIKESPLFNTGIILSEKQFMSWRLKEKNIQEKYRIKEIEELKEKNREKALIKILEDLNIISDKIPIYEGPEEKASDKETDADGGRSDKRYPLVFRKIIERQRRINDNIRRPATVECACIKKEYIDKIISKTFKIDFQKDADFYFPTNQPSSIISHDKPLPKRSKSASFIKRTATFQEHVSPRPLTANKIKTDNKEKTRPLSSRKVMRKDLSKSNNTEKENDSEIDAVRNINFISGFSQLPRWKRQLLMEAPVGLNDNLSKRKVQVIMSQSQKRKDLEELIKKNVVDIEKIVMEKAEEQKRKIDDMKAALREMDEIQEENKELS